MYFYIGNTARRLSCRCGVAYSITQNSGIFKGELHFCDIFVKNFCYFAELFAGPFFFAEALFARTFFMFSCLIFFSAAL